MPELRTVPDSTVTDVYTSVLGLSGSSKATATLKYFPVTTLGSLPRLYLAAGANTLTTLMMRGGVLSSTSAGSTTLLLPTTSRLGVTRNGANPVEMCFLVQRTGLGGLFVNSASNKGTIASQAAMLALVAAVEDYCVRSDLSNAVYMLTALPASTLGNWTVVAGGLPSAVSAIVWNNLDTQYLPQYHPPVMLTTYGDNVWYAS